MKQSAYTLIEVMIAMAIFACVAVLCSQDLKSLISQKESLDLKAKPYYHAQKMQRQLQEDVTVAVDFQKGGRAFMGTRQTVSLWKMSRNNAGLMQLSQVQYDFEHQALIRKETKKNQQISQVFSDLKKVDFAYLDAEQHWQATWPDASCYQAHLPRAIKVEIQLKTGEKLSWIFSILSENWLEEGEKEYEKSLPS